MMSETQEAQIQRLGATAAPRVTPQHIAATIAGEKFIRATETLTICVLTLVNGFTVTGESACASPENYNQAIGERISRENATDKIWVLEGYLLKQRLHDPVMPEIQNLDVSEQPGPEGISDNTRWRKKPVVVDAVQYTGWNEENSSWQFSSMPVPAWLHEAFENGDVQTNIDAKETLVIGTLEGDMTVTKSDWIIRGVKGEIYPCKPDIFEATYDVAARYSR